MKLKYLLLVITFNLIYSEQIIFQSDNFWGTGDNLASLYNAYVYAQKYNLKLYYSQFAFSEQFECSNRLKPLPVDMSNAIEVRTERDIIANLHKPNAKFYVNVVSQRLVPDEKTAKKAKRLLMPNKNLDLSYLNSTDQSFVITVHVRKGNNPENYQGELSSTQLYDYDRGVIKYSYAKNTNPFALYAAASISSNSSNSLDAYWALKYPPEQFYIDQINRIILSVEGNITVRIITDEKNPLALVERFKSKITDPRVRIEYYDNTAKDFKTRIIEDLYIMSKGDIAIHAKSSYAFVADIMGDHKSIILPEYARWIDNKLIITDIVIQDLA